MSAKKYWIWLSELRGVKDKTKAALLEYFEQPERIYFATESELTSSCEITGAELERLREKKLDRCDRIMGRCRDIGADILTLQDSGYPERLRNIFNPPYVLYIMGRLPAMDEQAAIGIVGTRRATPYGRKMALNMGYEIAKGGGCVVSGLAAGIDSAGAEGALRAGGGCVGVLGTAIDVVYPKFNADLFEDVRTVGALVSEYPPGTETNPGFFPQRNRIISGLSVGVLVIEAPKKSGALITAARALEQGRDLFVVPGNADAFNCVGSNELIKDCAKAVTSGWDILCEYECLYPNRIRYLGPGRAAMPGEMERERDKNRWETAVETGSDFVKLRQPLAKKVIDNKSDGEYIDLEGQLKELSADQLRIVSVMTMSSMHIDDIIDLTTLPAATVLSGLTLLELSGHVSREKGKRFTLNIKRKSNHK